MGGKILSTATPLIVSQLPFVKTLKAHRWGYLFCAYTWVNIDTGAMALLKIDTGDTALLKTDGHSKIRDKIDPLRFFYEFLYI